MSQRIHDEEPDTSEMTVRRLLAAERPEWSRLPIEYLDTSGTDNAMWRLRSEEARDLVVRLPRRLSAAAKVGQEVRLLTELSEVGLPGLVRTPMVRHMGSPHETFPHDWSVLEWLDGNDAWTMRHALARDHEGLAAELGAFVLAIGEVAGLAAPVRAEGERGGPVDAIVRRIDRWLTDPRWDAASRIDVGRVRRLTDQAAELAAEAPLPGFTHGDLIPGNLLVRSGRLSAVIDWGGAGHGDRAQDLSPAWAVFDQQSRSRFLDAVGADEATIIRGRTFELEHAVGGVLYYEPRGHVLGDVMRRTLERILAD